MFYNYYCTVTIYKQTAITNNKYNINNNNCYNNKYYNFDWLHMY